MARTVLAIVTAIMAVGVLGTGLVSGAEALKARGVGVAQYGSGTNICGLMFCSDYPGGKEAYREEWVLQFLGKSAAHGPQDTHHASHVPVYAHHDGGFPARLDVVIHEFELGKISAGDAMEGIIGVYDGMAGLAAASDIVRGVGEKIALYDSGALEAEQAVEAIHLTAEPQNVNPEFIAAIEEYTYRYELGEISVLELIDGIAGVHGGMADLTVTSDLIEDVGAHLAIHNGGQASPELTAENIHNMIEEAEIAAASMSGIPEMRELPPNTVDMPAGTAVPGCEAEDWCFMPSHITVGAGTAITWLNSDALPHTVTSGTADAEAVGLDMPDGFDSGFMSGGDEYSHTFDVAGHYDYYCQMHPWMAGSVAVE